MVEKDRSVLLNKTYQMIILPKLYQNCFQNLLTPTQYKMLEIVVMLLQFHKTVTIEKLATLFPQPIRFESRLIKAFEYFGSDPSSTDDDPKKRNPHNFHPNP